MIRTSKEKKYFRHFDENRNSPTLYGNCVIFPSNSLFYGVEWKIKEISSPSARAR